MAKTNGGATKNKRGKKPDRSGNGSDAEIRGGIEEINLASPSTSQGEGQG